MLRWRGLPYTRYCLRRAALPDEIIFTKLGGPYKILTAWMQSLI